MSLRKMYLENITTMKNAYNAGAIKVTPCIRSLEDSDYDYGYDGEIEDGLLELGISDLVLENTDFKKVERLTNILKGSNQEEMVDMLKSTSIFNSHKISEKNSEDYKLSLDNILAKNTSEETSAFIDELDGTIEKLDKEIERSIGNLANIIKSELLKIAPMLNTRDYTLKFKEDIQERI